MILTDRRRERDRSETSREIDEDRQVDRRISSRVDKDRRIDREKASRYMKTSRQIDI